MERVRGKYRHTEGETGKTVDPKKIIDVSGKMGEALASPEASKKWNIHREGSMIVAVTTKITGRNHVETVWINLRDPLLTDKRTASIALTSAVNIDGQTDKTTTYSFVVMDNTTIQDERTVSEYNETEDRFKPHKVKGNRAFEYLKNELRTLPGIEGI